MGYQIATGNKLTPARLSPNYVRKTAEPANNTAGYVSDPELALVLAAAPAVYALTGCLWYQSPAAANFKMRLSYSGTGNMRWSADGPTLADKTKGRLDVVFDNGDLILGSTGGFDRAWVQGGVSVTTLGTLTLQWAQNTANAGPTFVLLGSWLRLERMP